MKVSLTNVIFISCMSDNRYVKYRPCGGIFCLQF